MYRSIANERQESAAPDCPERAWRVIRTQPRQERSLRQALEVAGITVLLPTIKRSLSYRGRMAVVVEPLYPEHLFMYADQRECDHCLASGLVSAVHSAADRPAVLRVLRSIAKATDLDVAKLPDAETFMRMLGSEPKVRRQSAAAAREVSQSARNSSTNRKA